MSRRITRIMVLGSTALVASLASSTALAQGYDFSGVRGTGSLARDVVIGAEYDILNQDLAVGRLRAVEARLAQDSARGDTPAVGYDLRRVAVFRHRIAVDTWLIRQNSLQDPGYYPRPLFQHPITCAAIADVRRSIRP